MMNFRYRKFPVDQDNCPFPDKKSSLRPVIQIDFENPKGNFGYFVLIDSGADYCLFHGTVGEQLGLDIKKGTPYGKIGLWDTRARWLLRPMDSKIRIPQGKR